MISRKEEERNEKIIRGLMKLPPNRRCINCNSLGPQYVCTNFWTFVCIACSGIHREFTHRVKSVSMSKFTSQEVEALQRGGNQRARETLLKDWDLQRQRLPDSSNVDRVREFIKSVYVDRRYAGGKVPDKPPRDTQNLKNHEDDTRRASSYHSYSQSPPYEYQYEERKYGKQVGVLSRKPGSDRGNYEGKVSSFVYSPGRLGEQMYEDRFANEGSVSRASDYSASSFGDPSKSATQSPNFQDKLSSPPGHPVRDILVEDARRQTISMYSEANVKKDADGVARTQRNASLGSFGSFDSNSVSVSSVNSGSLIDLVSEPEQSAGSRSNGTVPVSSVSQSSFSANVVGSDPFGLQLEQQSAASSAPSVDFFKTPQISRAPSIDLFADIIPQHVAAPPFVQKPSTVPFPENQGWATFDLPQHEASISQMKNVPSASKARVDVDSLANANMQWASVSYTPQQAFLPVDNQWNGGSHGVQASSAQTNQSWNAFGDTHGSLPQVPYENLPYMNKLQATEYQHPSNSVQKPPAATDQYLSSNVSEGAMSALSADRISSNPFDLPYDSQLEVGSAFLNMSSLQAALPDSQLPPAFVGNLPQPWFPQNTITPYLQTTPQGGMPYMAGDAPVTQLPNIPSQGSVASVGGNPFA